MKKFLFIYLFIFLTIIYCSTYIFALSNSTNPTEKEISSIIQNAYIKEVTIIFRFKEIIQQCKNYSNVLSLLKIHQENANILSRIMEKYALKIPVIKTNKSDLRVSCTYIFQDIALIETDLLKIYSKSLNFLHTLPKNETIGSLIEIFEKFKSRLENEDYYIITKDIDFK